MEQLYNENTHLKEVYAKLQSFK